MTTEADAKSAITDYLQFGENQGKWIFMRLNSGSFILSDKDGNFRRRVQGTPKGTADFMVLMGKKFQFSHQVRLTEDAETVAWFPYCKVIFLEAKSKTGKQSKEQKEFQVKVEAQGCRYFVVRSVEEVQKIFPLVLLGKS